MTWIYYRDSNNNNNNKDLAVSGRRLETVLEKVNSTRPTTDGFKSQPASVSSLLDGRNAAARSSMKKEKGDQGRNERAWMEEEEPQQYALRSHNGPQLKDSFTFVLFSQQQLEEFRFLFWHRRKTAANYNPRTIPSRER